MLTGRAAPGQAGSRNADQPGARTNPSGPIAGSASKHLPPPATRAKPTRNSRDAHTPAREAQELARATVPAEIPPREPARARRGFPPPREVPPERSPTGPGRQRQREGLPARPDRTTAKSKTDVCRMSRRRFTVRVEESGGGQSNAKSPSRAREGNVGAFPR